MNRTAGLSIVAVALLAGGAAAGYWWGTNRSTGVSSAEHATPTKDARKVLYYRNPMGADTSPVPKKAPDGMDYVPVYADEAAAAKGKLLYYRNPMGLPDTSPVPKKDSMGMDYVPVYEGDLAAPGTVKVSVDKVQKLGVKVEAASLRTMTRVIRAVGTLQPDERRQYTVAPKFEGWIQRLHVNATGTPVRRGEALMEVYSPELITAQQEYAIATKGIESLKDADPQMQTSMKSLAESSLQRLRNWDISEQEIQSLQKDGKARNSITFRSPASGIVMEKPSIAGMRFMPGEVLYRIVDLSSLWLIADVFEQDIGVIRIGQEVKIFIDSYPGKAFTGRVSFLYPTVTAETRTAKVRIELPNSGALLKPSMYAQVEFKAAEGKSQALTVPTSAVLDSGTRQMVLVQRGEGLFEPREVKLGARGEGYVEVLTGLKQGEEVVTSANFLIDAESNLKAALGGFGAHAHGSKPPEAQAPNTAPPGGAMSEPASSAAGAHKGH